MTASRDAAGRLIVTNVEWFIRILLGLAAGGIVAAWLAPISMRSAWGWTALSAVFSLALSAANERSLFAFERHSRTLRWRRDTPFRHAAGDVPFAAITALSIEHDFRSASPSKGRGGARRLVLLTTEGPIPVTSAFTGIGSDAETVGREIQMYLKEVAGHEIPLNGAASSD